jgi:hypothetical protein
MKPEAVKILYMIILAAVSLIVIPAIFTIIWAFAGWPKLNGYGIGVVVGIIYAAIIYSTQKHKY